LEARRQRIKNTDPELYQYYTNVVLELDKLIGLLNKRIDDK
jgi:hypothetical protein